MGRVVRTIIGVGAAIIGAVTGNFALVFAGVSMAGAALLEQRQSRRRDALAATLQTGEVPRQAVFGRAAVAGSLVDAFNFGGKHGTDWEVLVIALADHRCDALEGFFVNDEFVPYTGDGDVPGFNGQLRMFWRDGTWGQEVPWILTDHGPGWTANDRGRGVCYAVVAYRADDEKAKNPVWEGRRPSFLFVLRGLRCYQPRKDSTVGGSGAHRRHDPATWEWTENPIDIRYNWVRGIHAGDFVDQPELMLIGRGLSAIEAPPQNVFARANLCDELVDGEPRYRIAGVVSADEAFIEVESDIAAACGGVISQPEGAVEINPGEARAPVAHFTDDDLIVGSKVSWSEFLGIADSGWINTVVARFVDPSQRWKTRGAPIRRDTADIIVDGGPREQTLTLGLVTSVRQAERVAEIARRFGRLWARGTVTLPPRFAGIEEGDWVTWQSDRYFKGATRTFRVEAWGSDEGWRHQLTLRQISASVFSETDPLDDGVIAAQQPPPAQQQPPVNGAWGLSITMIEAGGIRVPALLIVGETDDPAAQLVVFEFVQQSAAPDAETVWTIAGTARPDVTRLSIPVPSGGTHYVAISYVIDGVTGPRRVLGPVTLGEFEYPDGTSISDLQPAEFGATQGAVLPAPGSGQSGNLKDQTGRIYDPGELLNASLSLTPSGRLEYRPLPDLPPIPRGQIALPDLGATSAAALRQAQDDTDKLATALATALEEASRTRETFTSAGFFIDEATGQVRISAIEQTRERVSSAEIRLNAAEANINLRATVNYVDQAIAAAVLDPSQITDLDAVFLRLTAAELNIDGLNATVTTLATATELSLVEGRVTTAEQAINALEGTVTTKVDSTTFDALDTRVTNAENTLTAIGDTAAIVNAVRSVRLVERDVYANAEADLRALLQGDRANRDQVAAIADARQELTTRIIDGDVAEAAARLALQARLGEAEASIATESTVRASGDTALAQQITQLTANTNTSLGQVNAALTAESTARASGDAALAGQITQLSADTNTSLGQVNAALTAESQARSSADNALAGQINTVSAAIASETSNRAAAVDQVNQARIDGDALLAAGLAQQATAARVLDGEASDLADQLLSALLAGDRNRREVNGALAGVRQEITAQIVEDREAFASSLIALVVRIAGAEASIITEQQVRASADQVLAQSVNSLDASFSAALNGEQQARIAAITAESQARSSADNALAGQINTVSAAIQTETGNRQAAITAEQQARADADSALAGQITQVQTTVNEQSATLTQFGESLNGVQVRFGVRLDVNGRVTGFVANNDGAQGNMEIVADNFRIWSPGMGPAVAPFEFSGGNLRLSGDLRVGGNLITDGTLTANKIEANGITRAYEAKNATAFAMSAVDDIVTIPIVMDRPGTIILIANYQFSFTSGQWFAEIAVDNSILQTGSSNNDRYASFAGTFIANSPGTYIARARAGGNSSVFINPGGLSLVVLRTYI